MTVRNWSWEDTVGVSCQLSVVRCQVSVVEEDFDLGAWCVAFAVGGDDDEAVGLGGGGEDRGAADGDGFDLSVHHPHASIVHPADLRDELARQMQAQRTIRPICAAAAEESNRATREKVVGA